MNTTTILTTSTLGLLLAVTGPVQASDVPAASMPAPQAIDLAICLDTSGSMSGLLNSAKQKLWDIVNDLAMAQPAPKLRVALLTFGNLSHEAENGWVNVDSDLTDDLDAISQKLFALSTNGGTEYVGRVLQYAGQLDWHPSDSALKLIIVAGNESADQDREAPFRTMCAELIARGVMVNSIYCGPVHDSIAPGWMEVANLAEGQFASIDQDNGTQVVMTPFDSELATLSTALNKTYLPFGARGQAGLANQAAQDANAEGLNSACSASRAVTKSQSLYYCSWDLVDACSSGKVKLDDVDVDELPVTMQTMTIIQRKTYVTQMSRRRTETQDQIKQLSSKRAAWVAQEMLRQATDDSNSLDNAIRSAIRGQAGAKGFTFKDGC
ncbi:MAG: vWA domain-containing protein [Phycisphaerales bacterium]